MIRAAFQYDRKGRIAAFRMEGHARGWRPWPDLICAGVSAIAQTVIGSLGELAGIEPDYVLERGYIACSLVDPADEKRASAAATLMEWARRGCLQIGDSYGNKYLTVVDLPTEDIKGDNHD